MAQPFPLVRRTFENLASLLAPDVCAGCDARIGILRVFCPVCAGTLLPAPPRDARKAGDGGLFDRERAAFAYGGALASAITSLKYGGRVDRARPLAHLLLRAIEDTAGAGETPVASVVVPVPLHRRRLTERGFNHAALLAAPVARALGARFAAGALVRTRDTPAQATLGRSARLQNVAGCFEVRSGERPVVGERVLLIDDVRTTGATLDACAAALREAGASAVETLVLAVSGD